MVNAEARHQTDIEWCHMPGFVGRTWNPIRGCSRVSPGCQNCYAERIAARFSSGACTENPPQRFGGFAVMQNGKPHWTGRVELIPEKLSDPLHWRKPSAAFVSMSDLFHEALSDEVIDQVLAVWALCPQHRLLILTKRAKRMRQYFSTSIGPSRAQDIMDMQADLLDPQFGICVDSDEQNWHRAQQQANLICKRAGGKRVSIGNSPLDDKEHFLYDRPGFSWPLKNVWCGVSVENQQYADERIPLLLQTPAAVRFVSYEPALGPVDFRRFFAGLPSFRRAGYGIDWLICGGESGPDARSFDLAWARSARDQCKAAGVPFFMKQVGAMPQDRNDVGYEGDTPSSWPMDTRYEEVAIDHYQGAPVSIRLKDRKGGDPAEWPEDIRVRQFPEVEK